MTTKKCSYKGCGSFTNSAHPTSETFYAFPKHADRLKLWMKLGGNLNEKEIPQTSRYFCSKHFDESKYVASNPRRKQLLSTAVPYACMESPEHDDMTIVDEYQCVVSSVHPIEEDYDANESMKIHDEDLSEEVANEMNCISESVETLETYEEDYQNEVHCPVDFEESIEVERKPLKRKLDQLIIKHPAAASLQIGPSKRSLTIVSSRPTSTINVHQHQQVAEKETYNECNLNNILPESNNITTFIFKGEEYVQMPKEQYNRERMTFINKIRSYEETIRNVKNIMDSVKI
ncbi:uncharacterized protein LOC129939642 [Eupeodes corollae]|uniref:uncharacterized protein LOC129939642 n=1 Tax=Eupeodes corollae TaxID=290404 RepID=UPI0024916E7D|nr:uncharacterized protein LOC129939642 [Eupeodes corollae]